MQSTVTRTPARTGIIHTEDFTWAHWSAMTLAAVTGIVHLYLYVSQEYLPFLAAGLGFVGAIALILLAGSYRKWIYLGLIPFTLGQMGAWVMQGMPDFYLGVFDKTVQVLLIALLVVLFLRDRRATAVDAASMDMDAESEPESVA